MSPESTTTTTDERQLQSIVEALLTELGRANIGLSLKTDLISEFGLGSLELSELLTRVERGFDVILPESALVEIRSAAGLLRVIAEIRSGAKAAPARGAPKPSPKDGPEQGGKPTGSVARAAIDEHRVIGLINSLLEELGCRTGPAKLSSDFERDLGLGSLERAELIARSEDLFGVSMPDEALVKIRNPGQLLSALEASRDGGSVAEAIEIVREEAAPVGAEGRPWCVPSEDDVQNLVDVARFRADYNGAEVHLRVLQEDGKYKPLSYAELWSKALHAAAGLAALDISKGDRVAMILPSGEEFFIAFLGILCAGGTPVPIYPPIRMDQLNSYLDRHARILENAGVTIALADKMLLPIAKLLADRVSTLRETATVASLDHGEAVGAVRLEPHELGLIQYTSGSTGDPKGVALSHFNLMTNIRDIGKCLELGPDDVNVTWLPLYHDMGLIGAWMSALMHAVPVVLMSPLQFLSKPERWLHAIHRFGGTIGPGPNFAFELCIRKIKDEQIKGIDLSTWKIAINGAEPVLPETLDRFAERFGAYGFPASAAFPVYGMAETCLGLTTRKRGSGPRYDLIDRDAFINERRAVEVAEDFTGPTLKNVCVGHPLATQTIKLVDPGDSAKEVPERVEGRILMKGPAVTEGYYKRPDATAAMRVGEWTDTGDLGYLAEGELFITGRFKDLIIKGGRNYHPQDIEKATASVDGIRKGCVVAFSVPRGTSEAIVVVAETREPKEAHTALQKAVTGAVVQAIGTPCDEVVLVAPGTIPKTSSGKLRRRDTRAWYLDGSLLKSKGSWGGLAWLGVKTGFRRSWQLIKLGFEKLYGIVAGFFGFSAFVSSMVFIVLFCHSRASAWWAARLWSRIILGVAGIPTIAKGAKLPEGQAILVTNHQSYLDQFYLAIALDRPFVFAAKKQAFGWFLFGRVLARLGSVPIDRKSGATFIESYKLVGDRLDQGELIHIFPEGTFTAPRGVRPFRLGAFQLAVEKQVPIIPVALKGARRVQRANNPWLRWGRVEVVTLDPIVPGEDKSLREVTRLRDAARIALAEAAGEPVLDLLSAELPPSAKKNV